MFLTLDQADRSVSRESVAELFFREWAWHARGRAKKRGLSFTVTSDLLTDMIVRQDFKCAVSGIDVEFKTAFRRDYRRHPFVASVDRMDNDRGYEPDNVRIVCLIVNVARSDFGDQALIKMARAIVAQQP